ncbi:MAG: tyrosine-type recombinase/integrase [Burkholderiaceae bacterium]
MSESRSNLGSDAAWHELLWGACALEQLRADRGEIAQQTASNFKSRCARYLVCAFPGLTPLQIQHPQIQALAHDLALKGLGAASIRQILQVVRKVLKYGFHTGALDRIPDFPTIRTASVPRGGFTPQELLTLWRTARRLAQVGPEAMRIESTHRDTQGRLFARDAPIPVEMRWLIAFMVNSFMRPSDLKNLQHQHVEVVRGRYTYLRLRLPESKRHTETIITLRPAVRIYERLLALAQSRERASPMDYVFYPEVRNRKSAMMAMDHHFRRVLEHAGLRQGQRGQTRSLYSLRHTAITFRLLYGQGIDLLTLAKNARTSVAMIEKFYASELNPEMNVGMLQSRRGA